MKKVLALALAAAMALSMVACGSSAPAEPEAPEVTYKTGLGVVVEVAPTNEDAENEKGAAAQVTSTIVAATFDSNDTIVSVSIDAAQQKASFDLEGKVAGEVDLRTKAEKEFDYNMVAYGGAVAEWFEQVDALEAWMTGKTLAEVTGMEFTENSHGYTDTPAAEDLKASCTISMSAFLEALQKAYDNAVETTGVPAKTGLGIVVSDTVADEDAENEKGASAQIDTTIAAIALDEAGTIVASQIDVAQQKVAFDMDGVAGETDLRTKTEKEFDYNMVAYGGAVAEWFEQVNAFETWMNGKTVADVTGMEFAENSHGYTDTPADEDLKASCTISMSAFLEAIQEAADAAK
ncbi:MAG: hypothetical protein IJN27_03210 [Oscillospiraceae bacterium]|nr:hypothetical protein [Oscillospiraceae bacterium]